MKHLATTSVVGRALQVSRMTVVRLADSGRLKSIRLPNGHRRFDVDVVRAFARAHGYPPECMHELDK